VDIRTPLSGLRLNLIIDDQAPLNQSASQTGSEKLFIIPGPDAGDDSLIDPSLTDNIARRVSE